ncbi:MAG: DEAD/DEAH box helicase family protein [Candidatus Thorarchaeota archaeon]|nr:DEAD/DEAH box helicase family protein [Candidatus Thorarchaeota archaeon]
MLFETKPFPHQVDAYQKTMEWLVDHDYFALFMDMGTGKTKVSIDIASNLFSQSRLEAVMLVAPNGVQEQWYTQEILKHTPVITTELLWRNSGAQYWQDKLYDFVGPKRESIELKLKKEKQIAKEKVRTEEEERKYQEERQRINDLFGDLEDGDVTEVIYSKPVEPAPERKSKWENQTDCLKWLCVNIDRFSTGDGKTFQPFIDFLKNHKTMIIIDEGTIIKNPTANRTKIISKLGKLAVYRMLLTGTPVTNSPFDTWSMMEFLRPGFWKCNYFMFKNRYGIHVKDMDQRTGRRFSRPLRPHEFDIVRSKAKNGQTPEDIAAIMGVSESNVRYIIEHPELTRPFKRLNEIKEAILPCSFTIKKEDCLDIPPKMFETILLDMSKEQQRVYNELKRKLLAEYSGHELTVQNKASLTIRLQQIAGGHFPFKDEELNAQIKPIGAKNPKIAYLKRDIAEAGNLKIIIWARFVPEIELIIKELRKEFEYKRIEGYYGAVNQVARNQIKNDFQEGQVDVLVINPQTGSRGLNLQASTLHYFYSNTYSLEHRNQAEDRSHRYGQTRSVQYKDLVMKGTVDEKVLISLRKNKEVLDYFRSASLEDLLG